MKVYFVPQFLPRTWTKTQWKEAYRWVRVKRKELAVWEDKLLRMIKHRPDLKEKIFDLLTNPPILLGPGMK